MPVKNHEKIQHLYHFSKDYVYMKKYEVKNEKN